MVRVALAMTVLYFADWLIGWLVGWFVGWVGQSMAWRASQIARLLRLLASFAKIKDLVNQAFEKQRQLLLDAHDRPGAEKKKTPQAVEMSTTRINMSDTDDTLVSIVHLTNLLGSEVMANKVRNRQALT